MRCPQWTLKSFEMFLGIQKIRHMPRLVCMPRAVCIRGEKAQPSSMSDWGFLCKQRMKTKADLEAPGVLKICLDMSTKALSKAKRFVGSKYLMKYLPVKLLPLTEQSQKSCIKKQTHKVYRINSKVLKQTNKNKKTMTTLEGGNIKDFQTCQIILIKCFNKNYETYKDIGNADPYTNTNNLNKARLSTLPVSGQQSPGSSSQSNQEIDNNQRDANWKGECKISQHTRLEFVYRKCK